MAAKAIKSEQVAKTVRKAKAAKTAKAERTEKTDQAERTERAEQAEKTERAETAKGTKTAKGAKDAEEAESAAHGEEAERAESGERNLTRDGIIVRYLDIYRRCMTEDPKAFDARGAAHALEQISKLLGLTVSAKDTDGNEIVLKLSEEADALGQ